MSKLPFYGNKKAVKGLNLNNPDGWANYLGKDEHKAIDSAWYVANLVRRANATASIPRVIRNQSGDEVAEADLPVQVRGGLHKAFWQASMALDRYGAAYWLHQRTRGGGGIVKWCSPWTVELDYDASNNELRSLRRRLNGQGYVQYQYDDMQEIAESAQGNRLAWVWSLGLQEIGVGLRLEKYAELPASLLTASDVLMKNVMDSGAILPHWISAETNPPKAEKDRLLSRIRRTLFRGSKSGSAVEVFPKSLEAKQIGTAPKDLAMGEVDDANMTDVSAVMQTPRMLLNPDVGANRALLDRVTGNWINDSIVPHAQHVANALNHHIFDLYGLKVELTPQALTINQEEERQRATAFSQYVASGMNPEVAAQLLGLSIPDDKPLMIETAPPEPQPVPTGDTGDDEMGDESDDSAPLRALEIAKLQNFIKHGKHKKRPFSSDVLTVAEIDHIIYAATADEVNDAGLWRHY